MRSSGKSAAAGERRERVIELLPLDTVPMRVADFCAVPDWIGQRDTERHLAFALKRHLSSYSPAQARVAMAVLPDGRRYKLDGHTRALAWSRGLLKAPPIVMVDVYYPKSVDEARALYRTFDAPEAAERAADRVHEALREAGLAGRLKSPLLAKGGIARALLLATGESDMLLAVRASRGALLALDALDPPAKLFRSGVLAAALAELRAAAGEALPFWEAYARRRGIKDALGMDAPEALARVVDHLRAARSFGGAADFDLARLALALSDGYRRGLRWKTLPRLGRGPSPREILARHGIAYGRADAQRLIRERRQSLGAASSDG